MRRSRSNVVSLREYVDVRFMAQKEAVAAALAAAKEAVIKAEGATERRFENSNEWRSTVETLQRTYMPRTEADQQIKALTEKVESNTARLNARDDRSSGIDKTWGVLSVAIGIIIAVVGIAVGFIK